MPTKDYQTDLLKRLANGEYAAQYLKAALDETLVDGNKSAFLLALKNVVEANIEKEVSIPKIDRVLRWFEKEGNNFVGETIIDNVSLEHLQKLFEVDSENPMYDCYPVESAEQINYLQNLLDFELNTKSYAYFIECDRE
jgi:hypothetical protein